MLGLCSQPAPPVGATINDTATLAGGFNPTGTIMFDLSGPGDTFCSGTAVSAVVSGGATPTGIVVLLSGPRRADRGSGAFIPQAVVIDGDGSWKSAPKTPTLTLSALADEHLNGVGTCAVPQVLGPAARYSCTFPVVFTGNAGDTKTVPVTATATDTIGRLVTSKDTFVLSLTDIVPTVTMTKVADPTTMAAPGGTFA